MNSMERVMTTINQQEPDRVPVFHMLSHYGAKEKGISIKKYFSNPNYVADTQLKMRKKYSNDCLYTFFMLQLKLRHLEERLFLLKLVRQILENQ